MHPLPGVGAVVDWFRGSALRPFLNPLDECEREEFVERYMRELADAYPVEPDGRDLERLSGRGRDGGAHIHGAGLRLGVGRA